MTVLAGRRAGYRPPKDQRARAEDERLPEDTPATDDRADETSEVDDESILDRMRGSGAGVEDPNIVGSAAAEEVDEHVQEDQPPEV